MKKEFINNLNLCPYCGGNDISTIERNADYDFIWDDVHCDNCDEDWQEIYTFSYRQDMKGNLLKGGKS